jgi:hypothetical protein
MPQKKVEVASAEMVRALQKRIEKLENMTVIPSSAGRFYVRSGDNGILDLSGFATIDILRQLGVNYP